jgi:hypothetical protein
LLYFHARDTLFEPTPIQKQSKAGRENFTLYSYFRPQVLEAPWGKLLYDLAVLIQARIGKAPMVFSLSNGKKSLASI